MLKIIQGIDGRPQQQKNNKPKRRCGGTVPPVPGRKKEGKDRAPAAVHAMNAEFVVPIFGVGDTR